MRSTLHWSRSTSNPYASGVVRQRYGRIQKLYSNALLNNRIAYLTGLAAGRDVLDVGIVEHTRAAIDSETWLHGHLSRVSRTCVGVDILPEEVEFLRSKGYDARCADLTTARLGETFDLIVCGEVLEHVSSPEQLLQNLAAHLRPQGRLIISVPNPWFLTVVIKNLFRPGMYVDNVDHVAWFDAATLCELGDRAGLRLDSYSGLRITSTPNRWTRPLLWQGLWRILGFHSLVLAKSVLYEFVPAESANP